MTTRVAFQGELGAFSDGAVRVFFGRAAEPVACREFADVAASVLAGEVHFGLLPVENTLAGSVVAAYDVLATRPLVIVGEVVTPIHHCMLGIPGASLDGITRVRSHPVALAQCTRWLASRPGVQAVAAYDTAGSARDVAAAADPTLAAIAGRGAADRYGLAVLAADVEDRPDNQTRFLVVAARDGHTGAALPRHGGAMKSALVAETQNAPGALVGILAPFAARGINLSKLESRPTGEPWRYRFLIEIDADAASGDTAAALAEARRHASRLDVLGSFPRWTGAVETGG
ncbi:prephenate dehydratase [Longimicrobium terrae]|uniref:Prephenate dehydratase n=1 Tax=Longimicrobium terrae TaxID=1639882 RepID=A0A841GZH8_9BACT|nr:prephenate dehydratase [Longimicrobium terrae]MBB4636864.1 prephenate dehydratase [Longimicrobium terrae]MBB6071136.1 prephenate dehydratase [Longimicrobium terrae]NNC29185.1 prephenate dehydratase [Longimicrobium terrae]